MRVFAVPSAVLILLSHAVVANNVSAESFLSPDGKVRTFVQRRKPKKLDLAKARPSHLPVVALPLPAEIEMAIAASQFRSSEAARLYPGADGTGADEETADPPSPVMPAANTDGAPVGPFHIDAYGNGKRLYTMARVSNVLVRPYEQAGLLFYNDGSGSGNITTCTAALIKPGVLVTAAHCLVPFGTTAYHTDFVYLPAYMPAGASSYGVWNATNASVLSSWTDGSDPCAVRNKICQDDVGVLTLETQNGAYLGTQTGYFSYATGNYSFYSGIAEIGQLGYSEGYDKGVGMLRTDAAGTVFTTKSNNAVMGSPLGNGSDGGPWVVNLGSAPTPTQGWSAGSDAKHNVIVGVTSWSTGVTSPNQQAGASPFLSTNITVLVKNACSATPGAC